MDALQVAHTASARGSKRQASDPEEDSEDDFLGSVYYNTFLRNDSSPNNGGEPSQKRQKTTVEPGRLVDGDIWDLVFFFVEMDVAGLNTLATCVRLNKDIGSFAASRLYQSGRLDHLEPSSLAVRAATIFRSMMNRTVLKYSNYVYHIDVDDLATAFHGAITTRQELNADVLGLTGAMILPVQRDLKQLTNGVAEFFRKNAHLLPMARSLSTTTLGATLPLPIVFTMLRHITTTDSAVSATAGRILRKGCPNLNGITIRISYSYDGERHGRTGGWAVANFLGRLRPGSLTFFELQLNDPRQMARRSTLCLAENDTRWLLESLRRQTSLETLMLPELVSEGYIGLETFTHVHQSVRDLRLSLPDYGSYSRYLFPNTITQIQMFMVPWMRGFKNLTSLTWATDEHVAQDDGWGFILANVFKTPVTLEKLENLYLRLGSDRLELYKSIGVLPNLQTLHIVTSPDLTPTRRPYAFLKRTGRHLAISILLCKTLKKVHLEDYNFSVPSNSIPWKYKGIRTRPELYSPKHELRELYLCASPLYQHALDENVLKFLSFFGSLRKVTLDAANTWNPVQFRDMMKYGAFVAYPASEDHRRPIFHILKCRRETWLDRFVPHWPYHEYMEIHIWTDPPTGSFLPQPLATMYSNPMPAVSLDAYPSDADSDADSDTGGH